MGDGVRSRKAATRGRTRAQARQTAGTKRPPQPAGGDLAAQRSLLDRADGGTGERLLTGLQHTHGNAYVSDLLQATVAQRVEPGVSRHATSGVVWSSTVHHGGEKGRRRPHHLFKGDTLVVKASTAGAEQDVRSTAKSTREFAGQSSNDEPVARVSGSTIEWRVPLAGVGRYSFDFDVEGGHGQSHHGESFEVVADLEDFQTSCTEAVAMILEKYTKVSGLLKESANAYHEAYVDHDADLKELGKEERVFGEVLEGAIFASLGGLAGGALGGTLGELIKKWLKTYTGASGALTDASKDVLKFGIRSIPRFQGLHGSRPDTSGDSTATIVAPEQGGGDREAALLPDPFVWLNGLSAAIDREASASVGALTRTIHASREARDAQAKSDFDEDPAELVKRDVDLDQVISGIKPDRTVYLRELWHAWLETYACQVVLAEAWDPNWYRPETTLGIKATRKLRAAAAKCGETLEMWLEKYASVSAGRAGAKADELNAAEPAKKVPAYPGI